MLFVKLLFRFTLLYFFLIEFRYETTFKNICLFETKIEKLAAFLEDAIEATKEHVQVKFARRVDEGNSDGVFSFFFSWENFLLFRFILFLFILFIFLDLFFFYSLFLEDEDDKVESDSSEEEEVKMEKANYPVGWDGNPIPFWLYKLHGLGMLCRSAVLEKVQMNNTKEELQIRRRTYFYPFIFFHSIHFFLGIEYKCEICGNFSYWGPRAFDRHFQEYRHSHGMKCLRLENTKEFHHVTKIQDALELDKRLKELV